MNKMKKHFARLRAEKQRIKPPTKAQKRNTILVKGSETRIEGSSKRVGEELESENLKKQKLEAEVDDDQEEVEMKKGKMGYFQIIRADGSLKRYSSMIQMLQNIDREDLETLRKRNLQEELFTHKEEIDLETAQTTTTAKLPILKQGEYDMWRLRVEQYFQVQDYALLDVIENGNSFKPVAQTTTNVDGTSTSLIPGPVTTKEKAQKKNDVKARRVSKLANTPVSPAIALNLALASTQLALLSMRIRRFFQKTGRKITINGSDTAGYDKSKVNAVKASACPSTKDDQGYVDSGCSRHIDREQNVLSLITSKEFDGGYVTFGGGDKGGKITCKGTLKTGSEVGVDTAYPMCWIRRIRHRYAVSSLMDMAYWLSE
ncbi:hypothetical protein Tco_0466521 [Tanacetum coccineum]